MAGSQKHEEGDYFPFSDSSPSGELSLAEPKTQSQAKSPSSAQGEKERNTTPRGPLFSDLGEAYRQITSRSASGHNAFLKSLGTFESTTSLPSGNLVKLPSTKANTSNDHTPTRPQDDLSLRPASLALNRPGERPRRASFDSSVSTAQLPMAAQETKADEFSGDTVDQLYAQYAIAVPKRNPSRIVCPPENGENGAGPSNRKGAGPSNHDGAVGRYDFHNPDFDESPNMAGPMDTGDRDFLNKLPKSRPPRASLPQPPPAVARNVSIVYSEDDSSENAAFSTPNSKDLLDANAQLDAIRQAPNTLMPAPLRIPSRREQLDTPTRHPLPKQQKSDEFLSDAASSVANHTEGSQVDPFHYDEQYQEFLGQPGEREITFDLKGKGKKDGPESIAKQSVQRGVPSSLHIPKRSSSQPATAHPQTRRAGRPRPEPRGHIDSLLLPRKVSEERSSGDIKVVITRNNQTNKAFDTDGNHDEWESVNLENSRDKGKGVVNRATQAHQPRDITNEGDWVTVATSENDFDDRLILPGTSNFKRTGDSLANYSDDEYDELPSLYGSQEKILQHPNGHSQQDGFEIRRLKDTRQPVMFRKQNHAFPENSSRTYSTNSRNDSVVTNFPLVKQPPNPYRQASIRNPKNLCLTLERRGPSNKYDFRDSLSEYAPAEASGNHFPRGIRPTDTLASLPRPEGHHDASTSGTGPDVEQLEDQRGSRKLSRFGRFFSQLEEKTTGRRSAYLAEDQAVKEFAAASSNLFEETNDSTRSKFNFPLIPLEEAQKRHKKQRDSGETDETEDTAARLQRRKSSAAKKRSGDGGMPAVPAAAVIRERASDLSRHFTPPDWSLHGHASPLGDVQGSGFSPLGNGSTSATYPSSSMPISPATPSPYMKSPWSTRRRRRREERAPLRRRHEQTQQRSFTNQSLQSYMEQSPMHGFISPEDYISDRADRRRAIWFYLIAVLSVIPFFPWLELQGAFTGALIWSTGGEVTRLTRKQRKILKYLSVTTLVLWVTFLAGLLVWYVTESKTKSHN
ncbi:hypothetical protein F4780DRAFT_785685 [Xylariomycetidae sp. FL0641]|nr:hypothetical protein F4780DRAFT_785685 [Xylariomycetidae sp. FL0641]